MFEELGYHGAGLGAVAKRAGVSRQAIYLHFPSKVELLTALHMHIFATDVVPAVERYPITDTTAASDALDATIAVDVEVTDKVWRIHEALTTARLQYPEVEKTLRPREEERYGELLGIVGVAVVGDPRRADGETVEPQQVEDADRRQGHSGQVRALSDHGTDE